MAEKLKVKFNRNVKYNKDLYVAGQYGEVTKDEYDELLAAGVIGEVEGVEEFMASGHGKEPVDLYTLSREELEKVNKADIVKFLQAEEIDFDEKAKKEELIELIAGE